MCQVDLFYTKSKIINQITEAKKLLNAPEKTRTKIDNRFNSKFKTFKILLHLINNLHPVDKIYLYAKDLQEPKYAYLINKTEQAGTKNVDDPKAFIEYSDDMDDVLDDINNHNKNRDKNVLIAFDDMIADIEYNKKFKKNN